MKSKRAVVMLAGEGGVDAFIHYVSRQVASAPPGWAGAAWFVLQIGDECAGIRLQDIWHPLLFLKQMEGAPPLRFGKDGFRRDLVDDQNPARHYVAFVFMGFWLPRWLALMVLYTWEMAGFVRYGGLWSQRDVQCGLVGCRHGEFVRACGPSVLPGLIAAELAKRPVSI